MELCCGQRKQKKGRSNESDPLLPNLQPSSKLDRNENRRTGGLSKLSVTRTEHPRASDEVQPKAPQITSTQPTHGKSSDDNPAKLIEAPQPPRANASEGQGPTSLWDRAYDSLPAIDNTSNTSNTSQTASHSVISIPGPIRELWNQAYDALRVNEKDLIKEYEAVLCGNLVTMVGSTVALSGSKVERLEQMGSILAGKIEEAKKNTWRLKFGTKEIPLKDLAVPVVGIISWADKYIGDAVSTNPYASIAWTGVSLLLPLVLNPSKQAASLATGLEYISDLIIRSKMREELYAVQYESNHNEQSRKTFVSSRKMYRDTLQELYTQILKFQAKTVCHYSEKEALKIALNVIKWNKWDSLLDNIKKQETAFHGVYNISNDQDLYSRHKESMNVMTSIRSDVSGLRGAIVDAQRDTRRTELLKWLSDIDPSENYKNAFEKREANTGDWLVKRDDDFKYWKIARNSLLWLNGNAGAGKSVLSSSVIKHLEDLHDTDPETALAYFYFSFNDSEKQSAVGMLRSLIKQLCCRRPDTPQSVETLRQYEKMGHHHLNMETLESILAATIHGFSNVYLVIDALDECPYRESKRNILLNSLCRIHNAKSENLHLLCTSRREPDIEAILQPLLSEPGKTDINLLDCKDAVDADIGLYIDENFASGNYNFWPDKTKEEARTELIQKADGMFQYISCQFDVLRNCSSLDDIERDLKDLPKGLDATYDRMLQGIEPERQEQVRSVLKWLAFSLRPLLLEEVAEAFIVDHESTVPFDERKRLLDPKLLLKHLPSLVTTIPKHYPPDFEIRLAHFSIKEYLVSPRICRGSAAIFATTERDAHLYISESCLAYHLHLSLSKKELTTNETMNRFKLWKYVVNYCTKHLDKAPQRSWPHGVKSLVTQVFTPRSLSLLNIFQSSGNLFDQELSEEEMGLDNLAAPLYCAASIGAVEVTQLLIESGAILDEVSEAAKYGTALQAAAYNDHATIVQLLLDSGASIDAQGGQYGTALQAAAMYGHKSIVELLLERGADVNAEGGEYGTALQAAARWGDKSTVQLLLDSGADINVQGGNFGALLQAAGSGHANVLEVLLENGANINAQSKYGTALHMTVFGREHRMKRMVRFLLDRGADINAQGGDLGTVLHAAAYFGNESIVELLLERGADVNVQGGCFGNALQAAIAGDKHDIANLLLSRGAKVDPPGEEWDALLTGIIENEGHSVADRLRKDQENPWKDESEDDDS